MLIHNTEMRELVQVRVPFFGAVEVFGQHFCGIDGRRSDGKSTLRFFARQGLGDPAMSPELFGRFDDENTVGSVVVEGDLAYVIQNGSDVAIIDVQLKDGKQVWPVADRLVAAGKPFVLATGGHVDPPPGEHADAPVLAKPYTIEAIEPALTRACGS